MPDKKLLFYSAPALASFAKKDIAILNSRYRVRVFLFNPRKKYLTPLFFLQQLYFLTLHFRSALYVSQFGGYHAVLPGLFARIFRRQSYIITGGTDCVSFPQMGYGNFSKKVLGMMTCLSYRLASRILPVHASLVETENSYDPEQSGNQGMLAFCEDLTTPYTVIHNGYSAEGWQNIEKKTARSFITVAAGASDSKRFKLKGLDLIIAVAERFPDCSFTIVGCERFDFQLSIPPNVILEGFADNEKLVELYSRHRYYMQLSISEGFPNAICEAMLCECIPIGSTAGALPDIIGDTGLVLPKRDLDMLGALIQRALLLPEKNGKMARRRIQEHFSIERRAALLLAELQ